jgi:hypothetical protein
VRVEPDGSDERVHESLSGELDVPHIGLEDGTRKARVRRGTALLEDAIRDERLSCHAGWPFQPALDVVSRRFVRLTVGVDKARRRARYRWTFLVSGLEHPTFTQIVADLTTAGRDKLAAAATALSAPT